MGRAHRALPGVGHGYRRVALAEQGEQVEPVQVLVVFRDERLGRFAGKNSEAFGWVTAMRDGIAVTKAVVSAVSAAGQAVADPAGGDAGIQGLEEREASRSFLDQKGKLREAYRSMQLL